MDSHEWIEFDGTQNEWSLMNGYSNVDENTFKMPGGEFKGVTLRAYDSRTGEWSIWWLDGREPGQVDTPVKGRFENGVGIFYSDDTLRGKSVRVRFTWSNITAEGAHWEQASRPTAARPGRRTGQATFARRNDDTSCRNESRASAKLSLDEEQIVLETGDVKAARS